MAFVAASLSVHAGALAAARAAVAIAAAVGT
jgi:hypothetical protein